MARFVDDDEIIDIGISGNIIYRTSALSVFQRYRDMTDMEFEGSYEIWTPRDIQCVAPSVKCGDVTSVKCLALCCDEPRYTMADINQALEIVKVAKSLYLCGTSLPEGMGTWSRLADTAAEMDHFKFLGSFNDDETIYKIEDECVDGFGRLVTRAKISGLINIKISDFVLFSEIVARELEREENICEEIGFKWNSENNMQEEVKELMEKISWKMKENPGPQYDVVIVK